MILEFLKKDLFDVFGGSWDLGAVLSGQSINISPGDLVSARGSVVRF